MKVLKNKKVRNLAIVLLVLGLAGGSYAYANTQNDQGKFGDGQKMAQGAPPNGQPPDGKGGSKGQGPGGAPPDGKGGPGSSSADINYSGAVEIASKAPKVVRPMRVPKGIKVLY